MEIPVEKIFLAQKMMIYKGNLAGKPVVTATQMLESMIKSPRPTRAEAADVANAVLDGSDCVMLSGKSAAGAYPELAVSIMARICVEAESSLDYAVIFKQMIRSAPLPMNPLESLASSAVRTANKAKPALIAVLTRGGTTAKLVAKYRPRVPVLSVVVPTLTTDSFDWSVSDKSPARHSLIPRGLVPLLAEGSAKATDSIFEALLKSAVAKGLCKHGDAVVALHRIGIASLIKILPHKIFVMGVICKYVAHGRDKIREDAGGRFSVWPQAAAAAADELLHSLTFPLNHCLQTPYSFFYCCCRSSKLDPFLLQMSTLHQSISATGQSAFPLKRSASPDDCHKLQSGLPFRRTRSLKVTTKKPSARGTTIPLAHSLYQTDKLEFHPFSTSSIHGLLEEVSKEGGSGRFEPSDHVLLVTVSSAVKLNERQIQLIYKKMQRLTGFWELRLENSIDPSLIAGFVINYCSDGSHVIDLSVKGQLAMLAARLESSDVKQMGFP